MLLSLGEKLTSSLRHHGPLLSSIRAAGQSRYLVRNERPRTDRILPSFLRFRHNSQPVYRIMANPVHLRRTPHGAYGTGRMVDAAARHPALQVSDRGGQSQSYRESQGESDWYRVQRVQVGSRLGGVSPSNHAGVEVTLISLACTTRRRISWARSLFASTSARP